MASRENRSGPVARVALDRRQYDFSDIWSGFWKRFVLFVGAELGFGGGKVRTRVRTRVGMGLT